MPEEPNRQAQAGAPPQASPPQQKKQPGPHAPASGTPASPAGNAPPAARPGGPARPRAETVKEEKAAAAPGRERPRKAGRGGGKKLSVPTYVPFYPRRQARFAPVRAVGNGLYALGYAAEYIITQIWRTVRGFALLFAQVAAWLAGMLWGGLAAAGREMGRGLTAPLRRFKRRRRQMRRLRRLVEARGRSAAARTALRSAGVQVSLQFAGHVIAYLLPVAAAAALVFTVYSIVSMQYALAVEVDGRVLGYVEDQNVVETAKSQLRARIRLAAGQEMSDWDLSPAYRLAWTDDLTSSPQLVNAILRNSENPGDLVEATGVYVDGELFSVTTEGNKLQAYLDEILAGYAAEAPEGAEVSFVRDVYCDVQSPDVFFSSSVVSYDDLLRRMTHNVSSDTTVVADGGQTLAEIAVANGLPAYVLAQRNPQLTLEAGEAGLAADEYAPQAGRSVVVRRAEPFLQVQITQRMSDVEYIPYNTVEEENPDKPKGLRTVVQQGQQGVREVWDDFVTVDGELVSRTRVDDLTAVLTQPVPEIVEVGTKDYFSLMPGSEGEGYIWPAPTATRSSRGIAPYHRGIDINAPVGAPLYACQSGTVIFSGWHYSWGYYVLIDHHNGMTTRYAHCSSLAVEAGQQVNKGEYIAAMGNTGNSSGPHLHLEFEFEGQLMDPLLFVTPPEGFSMPWR